MQIKKYTLYRFASLVLVYGGFFIMELHDMQAFSLLIRTGCWLVYFFSLSFLFARSGDMEFHGKIDEIKKYASYLLSFFGASAPFLIGAFLLMCAFAICLSRKVQA